MARDTRMELGECVGSVLGHLGLECGDPCWALCIVESW